MKQQAVWLGIPLILLAVVVGLLLGSGTAAAPPLSPSIQSDGQGIATLIPNELNAGITETFCLIYTATGTISTDGGIRILDPDFHGMGWSMWQTFQDKQPAVSGFLTLTWTNPSADLKIDRTQTPGTQDQSYTTIVVTSGQLLLGDEVKICHTNSRSPHKSYQHVTWQVFTDADADGVFAPLGISPWMDIQPSPTPTLMVATGPTYVEQGVPFTLTVRVLDEYSNPCQDFTNPIQLTFTATAAANLPAPSPLPPNKGVRDFSATLNELGIHYIYVDPLGPMTRVRSNPFVVVESLADQPQLFWGDLHAHHGYVYTTPLGLRVDEFMDYARDIADLDFVCESHKSSSYFNTMTSHVEIEASVVQYNDPGRFVTIRGYEWMGNTGDQGHHNWYFDGPSAGNLIYSPDDEASDTLDEMWWLLEENLPQGDEVLGLPHALLPPDQGSGSNWTNYDEFTLNRRYRPLAEIYSHWGSSEMGGGSAREALIYGNRIGFYGSSDTHFAYPGNPETEKWGARGSGYVGGLAAVRADALTREKLWEGLTSRSTYATEGERIFLDFSVNGYPMGSEISSTVAPHIVVTAAGTAPISELVVFKGSYVTDFEFPGSPNSYFTIVRAEHPNQLVAAFEAVDDEFEANTFYYARVQQVDGRRAWSSPVWVDYGQPLDLWAGCGDGVFDAGESLVSCPADVQVDQRSWLTLTHGAPTVFVEQAAQTQLQQVTLNAGEATSVPMIGLYVYNVSNITGYVPYTSSLWLPFMQQQVDRAVEAGLSYLGFSVVGPSMYDGPSYPTVVTASNESHWDIGNLDDLFDYAAHKGVYLLPTTNASTAPNWWITQPITHETEMIHVDNTGTRWKPTASFDNQEYWDAVDPLYIFLFGRYRDHPALLGWDVRVGQGENNYPPPYTMDPANPPDTWCDYSIHARDRFRAWLADRYGSTSALRAAWISPTVTLATAQIPEPLPETTPLSSSEMIPYVNSDADQRPEFRDWLAFRLDEKWAETQHFVGLYRSIDPEHIILNDPAYHPLADSDPRSGRHDGDRAYRGSQVDAVIHHPRVAQEDEIGNFNTQRSTLYATDQYALRNDKLSAWVNEETSEVNAASDLDNIWRLASIDILHSAMGQGDGWVVGKEGPNDPSNGLPSWSINERTEMRRLAPLHTAPELHAPREKIAILTDDFAEGFNYRLEGQLAFRLTRASDRKRFIDNLFDDALGYDFLTVGDVLADSSVLQDYEAVLVINLPRLTTTVALDLDSYRDSGGGLFVAGVTGVMDDYGRGNTTALGILLDAAVTGFITQETKIDEWTFDVSDSLAGDLEGTIITDNLYYIPTLPPAAGFTAVAHLNGGGGAPVVGYKGRTVFWFPRLTLNDDLAQIEFQENLWAFFGVEPNSTADNAVEVTGGNYKSVFTSLPTTVHVALSDDISTTGALVWDWNQMQALGVVEPQETPGITLTTAATDTYFLGVTPLTDEVQFVALGGGLLGEVLDDVAGRRMAVGIYRATPGEPVTVAIYRGSGGIMDVYVVAATITSAQYDPTGQVYLITVVPLEERLTITAVYQKGITGLTATNDGPTALGQATTLSASITAGDDVSYTWDFGDEPSTTGNGATVQYTYPDVGIYTAIVTAANSVSLVTATTTVTVDEVIEGLIAINDGPTQLGQATTLTATITSGSNETYAWDFGDGESVIEAEAVVQHAYGQVGDWTAMVTASNSVGWASATTLVVVEEIVVDEAIEGLTAVNDSPTLLGHATTLTATVTAGSNVVYTWAFGDGASSTGSGAVVQFTYPAPGDYVAVATASNSVSLVTTTTTVEVTPHRVYLPIVLRDY